LFGSALPARRLTCQRLSGASLLVFKNKSDVPGAMTEDEVREVCDVWTSLRAGGLLSGQLAVLTGVGPATRRDPDTQMAHHDMQRHDWLEPGGRAGVGGTGRQSTPVPVLMRGGTTGHGCDDAGG
jgi:hypothetical protein